MLGSRQRTFAVEGHHYALVVLDDLEPGAVRAYTVELDGFSINAAGTLLTRLDKAAVKALSAGA